MTETGKEDPVADKPNDRLDKVAPPGDEPEPKVYLVVGGEKFVRPSLETYYARAADGTNAAASCSTVDSIQTRTSSVCSCNTVAGTYCKCNKVCTCNLVCACQGHAACSCVGYVRRSYGGGSYCSCNKVCTCVPVH